MERRIHHYDDAETSKAGVPIERTGALPSHGELPRIGVIYNPRSHRNKGQDLDSANRPGISVAQPAQRSEIADALARFAAEGIDYLIINGGDGTVRDVLTMGQGVFGDRWPAVAVLPKGKTNALNVDIGAPADWSLPAAIEAYSTGERVARRPLSIRRKDGEGAAVLGFILGAGVFTTATQAGQEAHELGFFNSLAVAMTALWGMAQVLFGRDSNRWRRGTEMSLHLLPGGEPVAHSRHGRIDRRTLIFASTLERMPVGVRPFGPVRGGLKLVVLDKPLRRVILGSPVILTGTQPRWIAEAGYHQIDTEAFEFDIAEPFIVDGEAFGPGSYIVEQGPLLNFVSA